MSKPHDPVHSPSHYGVVPGVECIAVTQHFNFNRGNAIKYLWRAGAKGDAVEDLRKAAKYIEFEIARLQAEADRTRQRAAIRLDSTTLAALQGRPSSYVPTSALSRPANYGPESARDAALTAPGEDWEKTRDGCG